MIARFEHLKSPQIKLLSIILISWSLLLWQLGQRSFWVDEFLTFRMISGVWSDVIAAVIADIHPPFYFIVLHGWAILVGSSDFALRLFSVISGIMGLALVVPITKRLIGPQGVVPATLLLGLAPAFIEFSRMTRYYSLLLTLGLLSTYLLLNALKQNNWRGWLAYAIASLILIYTFYPSIGLIGAHGLMIRLYRPRWNLFGRWLITLFFMSVGSLPWFFWVARDQVISISGRSGADFSRSMIGFILGVASSFYTFSLGETLFPWQPAAWLGLVVVFILLVMGIFKRTRKKHWPIFGLFMVSVFFIAFVTTFVNPGTPFLNVPVRALFALPCYLLILTAGLINLPTQKWRMLCGGVLIFVWGISTFNNFTEQQFLNPIYITPSKEAAAFVYQNANTADLVISEDDSVFDHYFLANETHAQHLYTGQGDEIQRTLQTLAPPQVWLITLGRDQTRGTQAENLRQHLLTHYQLESVQRYLPIDRLYLQAKNFVLRRNSYEYRLTVETYVRIRP